MCNNLLTKPWHRLGSLEARRGGVEKKQWLDDTEPFPVPFKTNEPIQRQTLLQTSDSCVSDQFYFLLSNRNYSSFLYILPAQTHVALFTFVILMRQWCNGKYQIAGLEWISGSGYEDSSTTMCFITIIGFLLVMISSFNFLGLNMTNNVHLNCL